MIHTTSSSRTSVNPIDLSSRSNKSASTDRQPSIQRNPTPSTPPQNQGGEQRSPLDFLKQAFEPLQDLLDQLLKGATGVFKQATSMFTGLLGSARSMIGM